MAFKEFVVHMSVRGPWERAEVASDHRAMVARVSAHGAGARQLQRQVCERESFAETFVDEFRIDQDIHEPSVRHEAARQAALAPQTALWSSASGRRKPCESDHPLAACSPFGFFVGLVRECASTRSDVVALADCCRGGGGGRIYSGFGRRRRAPWMPRRQRAREA